jgi:transcriptional regulator with XRE-family HTH domain
LSHRLSRTLAARLRAQRRRRGFSLRTLASASGLSPTTIHQIEAGRGSPSLATLQALATTLGVGVGDLLQEGKDLPGPAVLAPARERPHSRTPGGSLECLASGLRGQRLHGLVVTLAPGRATGDEAMTHAGQEMVLVLSGRCAYEVAGREYLLGPGDSLLVDSRQPHLGRNPGRREARLLVVLDAPGARPTARGRASKPPRRRS